MAKTNNTCYADECERPVGTAGLCHMHYKRLRKHNDLNRGRHNSNAEALEFLKQTIERAPTNCVLWPYGRTKDGYGATKLRGSPIGAHRAALILSTGLTPPPEIHAAHYCHVRLCVNPKHLRWATAKENVRDTINAGTITRGREVHTNKLTESQVLSIFQDDRPARVIASEYGITKGNVWYIQTGKSWGWLTNTAN